MRTTREFFARVMGSLTALLGFAGVTQASATVDLIWIDVSETNHREWLCSPACTAAVGIL